MMKHPESNEEWGDRGLHPREDFTHRVDCHGASITGSKRSINEDDFLIAALLPPADAPESPLESEALRSGPPMLLVVADGVGGSPAGERASSIAVRELYAALTDRAGISRLHDLEGGDPEALLKDAVTRGQRAIEAEAERHFEQDGMGTTLTAALILWPKAHIVHVGDSRCYHVRRSSLQQVTTDHTIGQFAPSTARSSRWRNVLWNVVGGFNPDVHPQVSTLKLHYGDALLLATDGLTDSLGPEELLHRVREGHTSEAVCANLIQAARKSKGRDDMTVVYAQFGRSSFWNQLREIFRRG